MEFFRVEPGEERPVRRELKMEFPDVEPLGPHPDNDRVFNLHRVGQRKVGVAAENQINARQGLRQFNIRRIAKMTQKNDEIGFRPDFSENVFRFLKGLAKHDSSGSWIRFAGKEIRGEQG